MYLKSYKTKKTHKKTKMAQIHSVDIKEYVQKFHEIQNCPIDKLFSTISIEMFRCLHHGEKREIFHQPVMDITYINEYASRDLDSYFSEKFYKTDPPCPDCHITGRTTDSWFLIFYLPKYFTISFKKFYDDYKGPTMKFD